MSQKSEEAWQRLTNELQLSQEQQKWLQERIAKNDIFGVVWGAYCNGAPTKASIFSLIYHLSNDRDILQASFQKLSAQLVPSVSVIKQERDGG
jgi:hypothetical protein